MTRYIAAKGQLRGRADLQGAGNRPFHLLPRRSGDRRRHARSKGPSGHWPPGQRIDDVVGVQLPLQLRIAEAQQQGAAIRAGTGWWGLTRQAGAGRALRTVPPTTKSLRRLWQAQSSRHSARAASLSNNGYGACASKASATTRSPGRPGRPSVLSRPPFTRLVGGGG
jgi:hypothetical protein